LIVDANQVTLREITADTVISIIRLSGFRHTGRMDGVEVILEIPLD